MIYMIEVLYCKFKKRIRAFFSSYMIKVMNDLEVQLVRATGRFASGYLIYFTSLLVLLSHRESVM